MNFAMNRNKLFVSIILAIVLAYFFVKSSFVQTMSFFRNMGGGYTKLIVLVLFFAVIAYLMYSLFEKKEKPTLDSLLNSKPKGNSGDFGLGGGI